MNESVHARERSGRDRCAYCHEEFSLESGERVGCAGCGTPHHAECFELNRGCSALGCECTRTHGTRNTRNPGSPLKVAVALILVTFVATLFAVHPSLGFTAVGLLAPLVLALVVRLPDAPEPELTAEPHEQPVPWARTLPPAHAVEAAQALIATQSRRASGALPEPSGPNTPCPSCGRPLEGTTDLRFCYHCGASLA